MPISLAKVSYKNLNSKQKEAHNFQKVSAKLADYGYSTIRLQDDWEGADFIAQHCGGLDFLKVQLKGRLVLDKRYIGKSIFITFPNKDEWYIYEHDVLLNYFTSVGKIINGKDWSKHGSYSWPSLPTKVKALGILQEL